MKKGRILLKIALVIVALVLVLFGAYTAYALATAESRIFFPETASPAVRASSDPAVIAQGRYLVYGPAHCAQCHSSDDRKHPEKVKQELPLTGGLEFAMGPIATRYASNLTPDRETGIGARTDAELARAIRTGILHNGEISFFMRLAVGDLSDEDLTAVISFLRSQTPQRKAVPAGHWGFLGKLLLPSFNLAPDRVEGPRHVPASEEPSVARGEYLNDSVMLCTGCHTPRDPSTFEPVGPKGSGSLPDRVHDDSPEAQNMEYVAPNLTSDPSGVTGQLTEDQFVDRIRAGRAHPTSIMPWESFGRTTESDLRSVYRYLRTLPAVHNNLGPSYREKGWQPPTP